MRFSPLPRSHNQPSRAGEIARGVGILFGSILASLVLTGCPAPGVAPQRVPAATTNAAADDELNRRIEAMPQDPAPRLELVRQLLVAGRKHDALDAAGQARRRFPESTPVREVLAESLAALSRYREAADALRPLAGAAPVYRIGVAQYLVRAGDRPGAVAMLRPLEGTLPAAVTISAGQTCLDALRFDLALPYFQQAVKSRRNDPDAQAHLGLALLVSGEHLKAVKPLEEAVKQRPQVAASHYYLGCALRLCGDLARLDEAERHLRTAVDLEPGSALHHYELGLVHVQLRQWDAARAELEQAVALKPDLPEAQRDLARLQERQGDFLKAAEGRARYLRLIGDAPAAVRVLEPVAAAQPDQVEPALALAEAYYDAWQSPKTLAVLSRLKRSHPGNRSVLEAAFRAERASHRDGEALATLDQLLQTTPEDLALLDQKADLLQKLSRFAELEALLEDLRRREPQNPTRHFQLGVVLAQWSARPNRLVDAEACFREAIRLGPKLPGPHFRLGLLLLARRQVPEAIASLKRAVDLAPRMAEALVALQRAYSLAGDRAHEQETLRAYRMAKAEADMEAHLKMPGSMRRETPAERRALGEFYLGIARYREAASHLESVVHADASDAASRRTLVALYGHLRRFQRMFEEAGELKAAPGKGASTKGGSTAGGSK